MMQTVEQSKDKNLCAMADEGDNSSEKNEKSFRNNIKKIWTAEQDEKLKELVAQYGMGWTKIGEVFGERNGKQCRERWYNHLDPAVNKGEWTVEEDRVLFTMQREIGNHWAKITKALPGRTDNAIKNRFNAACRNHALLMASNAAAGLQPRDITLYDALHMHDVKAPSTERQCLPSKIIHEISAEQSHLMQQAAYQASLGNMAFHSPLGARSLSPSSFNESSKYPRIDMTPQQIQQQHFFHYQQQQQQLYQQQQEQQLHLAQMQQHQLQLQHQMQQQQLQQFTNRQRAVSMQTPHSGLSQTPRPLSMNNSIRQNSSHDFRQARLSDETDMDMAITPELFDRIALSNISMPIPVAHAHHTTVTVNAVQAQEYSNAPTSAVPSRSNQTSPHHNSQNGGNIVFGNFYQNSSSSPNNTGPANAAGSSAVSPNNNNININQSTGYGLNSNSGSFIDFDESIFEDWVSDDTEMDFIDTTVPSKPTVCDFLLSGCASSQGFCSGSNTNGTGQYYSHQSSTYAQNTNGMCCGFPTAFSGDHTDQQSRQPAVGQQMVHGQSQVPQQITLNKSKPSGFGSSIRALGNRICGPGQVDSSYQHLDTAYDSKVYPGSQAMIKQEGGRTPTVMGPGLTSSYGQTALREQYAASRSKLDNRNGVSTGGAYPTQGFVQDGHVRSGYNSYFVGPAIVQMNTTINLNTAPPSPYTNPGYVYVNDSSDKTPAAESVMQSYTDTERSQSLGHC